MDASLKLILEDMLFSPVIFLVMVLMITIWPIQGKIFHPKMKWLLAVWLIVFILSSSTFFRVFTYPLRVLTPPSEKRKADVIVVASAGVHDSGAPSPGSTLRAHTAAQLYLEKLAPMVVVTGGVTTPYQPPVGIKGIHIILKGMGVPDSSIIIENRSFDTYENGIETAKILDQLGLKRILLVSHDYHLPRLVGVFQKQGFEVYPYAANQTPEKHEPWWAYELDWKNFNSLRTIAHEYIGLFTYKLTGRI